MKRISIISLLINSFLYSSPTLFISPIETIWIIVVLFSILAIIILLIVWWFAWLLFEGDKAKKVHDFFTKKLKFFLKVIVICFLISIVIATLQFIF